jgi:periplasmic protein TonB
MSKNKVKVLVVVGALIIAGLVYGVWKMLSGPSSGPTKAPKISLIPIAPPPPPPPPKEEKRPEPPKEQKEVKMDQPAPKDAPPAPANQDLKMEGAAGDGPSAFGAGKVSREDLSNINNDANKTAAVGGMFNPFTNYATSVKGELQRFLSRNKDLRLRAYKVDVLIWVTRDGRVNRFELQGSSGDTEVDDLLRQAIGKLETFSGAPPEKMPQPIHLRLITGGR